MSILRFEPLLRDPFREFERLFAGLGRGPLGMPMDAYRRPDGWHLELDLPGIDPHTINLTVERDVLTVRAERRPSYSDEDEVLVSERPQGQFTRQLILGEGLDVENLSAEYHDGVLDVRIPSHPRAQPRRIRIARAGEPGRRVIQGERVPEENVEAGGVEGSAAGPAGTTGGPTGGPPPGPGTYTSPPRTPTTGTPPRAGASRVPPSESDTGPASPTAPPG